MKKSVATFIFTLVLFQAYSTEAEEIKALIDLEFIEDTEITSGVLCYDEENCHPWSTYYLFSAHVLKVVTGQLPEDGFKVIFGRHALQEKDFPNVLATMEILEPANEFYASYKILELEWDHGL